MASRTVSALALDSQPLHRRREWVGAGWFRSLGWVKHRARFDRYLASDASAILFGCSGGKWGGCTEVVRVPR